MARDGTKTGGKVVGSKNKVTLAKELLNNNLWDTVSGRVTNEGIEKCWNELSKLEGKDYVFAFMQFLEYFKPKLQRTTLEGGDKPIQHQVFKVGGQTIEF